MTSLIDPNRKFGLFFLNIAFSKKYKKHKYICLYRKQEEEKYIYHIDL